MRKSLIYIMAFTVTVSMTSCSGLVESTRKMIDGDSPRKNPKKAQWVTKSQYDDLMVKYKNLSEKYENLKESKGNSQGLNQASELSASGHEEETVDVFGKNGLANEVSQSLDQVSHGTPMTKPLSANEVDQEVKTYKKAVLLEANGKVEESLKVFQFLEKSQTKQIRVRARIHIGQIYLLQKQYDLALQVFESILSQDAFSSKVLDALRGAASASGKLGLAEKKIRYESMLKDVFGLRG